MKYLPADEFLKAAAEGVVLDVRTPAEYAQGHLPGAANLPLFSDAERAEVGTLYVREGKEAAVQRGLEHVGPRLAALVREARKLSQGKPLLLYCWRGGMRSGSVGWLLDAAGMDVILLKGGYKAYRRSFARLLESHAWRLVLLGGPTGCGKTEVLHAMRKAGAQVIDLEGLARHRGSVFGALGQPEQPTTETFINRLHDRMRQLDPARPVWCEAESVTIGHVFIPSEFFSRMQAAPRVHYELPLSLRIERLAREYGRFPAEELTPLFGKIEKRLGGERTGQAVRALEKGDVRTAAEIALQYYDKAYARSSGDRPVLFTLRAETDLPEQNARTILAATDNLLNA